MKAATPLVISSVVENDLCVGCGVCVQACANGALDMAWDRNGFLVPESKKDTCDDCGACIDVCPFNPEPQAACGDEDALAKTFLGDAQNHHPKVGRYDAIYAGYSKSWRETSSSGGMGTFIFEMLFKANLIDYIITVGPVESSDNHYHYRIVRSVEELLTTSKTRYYPVTLADLLKQVRQLEGRVAISGVGCFIKAIRLAQSQDPVLRNRIAFLVGIICGGLKSKFFTDYLAGRAGVDPDHYIHPEYRVKAPASTALDYSFSCYDVSHKALKQVRMRDVGDMWGTGLFKANACDFCDDVTTELADISLGDAWLHPYIKDGKGTSIVVIRSPAAQQLLNEGSMSGELVLERLTPERLIASQQGSFNHRHDGLGYRITRRRRSGYLVPSKRLSGKRLSLFERLVQIQRMRTRARSLVVWGRERSSPEFDQQMKMTLMLLRRLTMLARAYRKVQSAVARLT